MKARLTSTLSLILALVINAFFGYSQVPQGFSYQAIVRNGDGAPIKNQNVSLRITLQSSTGTAYYSESKNHTTSDQGVITHLIGGGDVISGTFTAVPWGTGDIYIKLEIDPTGGSTYSQMGTPTKLLSVPYALYADNTKEVVSLPSAGDEDPIFVVRNKLNQIVFAVYQSGVRVYVADTTTSKGAKGGFAVAGLTSKAGEDIEYMRITPDSARIYINDSKTIPKGAKGGFAVAGLTSSAKLYPSEYIRITPDSARIYVNEGAKGAKGGFAVAGLTSKGKTSINQYLNLTPDNYFIGQESGKSISSGMYNSFIGFQSGQANTTGSRNLFLGYNSGFKNIYGKENIFIGNRSGYNNEGIEFSDAGSYNIFLGTNSGSSNTTGAANVFLGNSSGINNSTGTENVFLGHNSGFNNKTGNYNIFMGTTAGFQNISGQSNVFIGIRSGENNTLGAENTFLGICAGIFNTLGNNNVAIGKYSGYYLSEGNNNTLLGSMAGSSPLGSGNVFIGYYAVTSDSVDNQLVITNNPTDNPLIWGDFATNKLNFTADVGIGTKTPDKKLHVVGDARITGDIYYGIGTDKYTKADYVFLQDYNNYLEPLKVDEFIKTNGHLPWYTAAKDEKNGINLTRMQFETVETVENLQLQIIEMKKDYQQQILKLEHQAKEIDALKTELEAIKLIIKK